MGIIIAVAIPEGMNNKPASRAVQPNMDWVYNGIINVEPYSPKPNKKERIVPTLKFPFLSTRNSTIGFLYVNSRQIKKKIPKTAVTDKRTIILSLNQSSS